MIAASVVAQVVSMKIQDFNVFRALTICTLRQIKPAKDALMKACISTKKANA